MSTQATITSELLRAVALSVFLPSDGVRDTFFALLSDIVVLRVERNNTSTVYIMIMERDSNQSCLINLWDYPLSIGTTPTTLVSWGFDVERLKIVIVFATSREARFFQRASLQITFRWLDEQDDDTLALLEAEVEARGDL
ncbi:hypothetical protein GSI_05722 [Ganoderma sinense ZZ0214-1]|uniref:Uncharacterized protein n=1 Tax=Ganoderma sinense ZZ0214-1 TaxID=1077348 RepID=A0A2G8SBQ1_9APHY|nr:hypothetical protein GSI_05722 [Ganoderma sinense ZZ0214-1]